MEKRKRKAEEKVKWEGKFTHIPFLISKPMRRFLTTSTGARVRCRIAQWQRSRRMAFLLLLYRQSDIEHDADTRRTARGESRCMARLQHEEVEQEGEEDACAWLGAAVDFPSLLSLAVSPHSRSLIPIHCIHRLVIRHTCTIRHFMQNITSPTRLNPLSPARSNPDALSSLDDSDGLRPANEPAPPFPTLSFPLRILQPSQECRLPSENVHVKMRD